MNDEKKILIETHGNASASQRREFALKVEIEKQRIANQYMRASTIWLLEQMPERCAMIPVADLKARMETELDTVFNEEKDKILFTIKDDPTDQAAVEKELDGDPNPD